MNYDKPPPSLSPATFNNQKFTPNQDSFLNGPQVTSFSGRLGYSGQSLQPPSYTAVREFVPSQPSGVVVDNYAYDQPPSFTNVRELEVSQPGNPVSGLELLPGMSLNASNFQMPVLNAYQKDGNGNN